MGRRVLRRVLRRASKKGLSRRHLEGRNTPFREYDPLGVRPKVRNAPLMQGDLRQIAEVDSLLLEELLQVPSNDLVDVGSHRVAAHLSMASGQAIFGWIGPWATLI